MHLTESNFKILMEQYDTNFQLNQIDTIVRNSREMNKILNINNIINTFTLLQILINLNEHFIKASEKHKRHNGSHIYTI